MRTKYQSLSIVAQRGFSPSLVVDVGVAMGTTGLYDTWSDARYVLVEALPKFQENLRQIATRLDRCDIELVFAGSAPGSTEIAVDPDHVHAHLAATVAPPAWERVTVPIKTVDAIVRERQEIGPRASIVLKIDVDGAEIDVLEGARATLTCDCVVVIEAALLDERVGRFGRIVSFMAAHGYEVYDIIEPMYRPGDQFLWQVDLIFLRRDSPLRFSRSYDQPMS